jgi:GNAT superfamily N-acetyltransferase
MSAENSYLTKLITTVETYNLRETVLRPGQPPEVCRYIEDDLTDTFHIGVICEGRVISNGTFIRQGHEYFPDSQNPYRLRGMATEKDFQKQGLGRRIIQAAEAELRLRQCDLLWFNARTGAEGFYKKLGFGAFEKIFDIPGAGPHKVMYRQY